MKQYIYVCMYVYNWTTLLYTWKWHTTLEGNYTSIFFFLMGSGTWVDFPRLLSWTLISLLHNPGCRIRWLWGIVTTQSLSHPSLSAFLLLLCTPSLQAPLLGSRRHTSERRMLWSQLWYYHRRDPGTGHISPVIAALKPVSPECGPWPLCK